MVLCDTAMNMPFTVTLNHNKWIEVIGYDGDTKFG